MESEKLSAAPKHRSALHATRNAATGQVVVLPQEDLQAFQSFVAALAQSFDPKGAHEVQLAQSYAGFQWRINRAAAVEDSLFTLGLMEEVAENLNLQNAAVHNAATNAKTFRNEAAIFDRISIYTQRLVHGAAKVLKQLQDLQAERRRREEREIADAARLYHFCRMQKEVFDPRENGFNLTIGQIKHYIRCTTLHNHAQIAENLNWDRPKFLQATTRAA